MPEPDASAGSRFPVRWVLALGHALAFLTIGLIAHGPNTLAIDLRVSRWVQRFDGPVGEAVAVLGNALGYSTGAVTFIIILSSLLALTRRHRELRFVVFVLLGRLIASRLKGVFDSPRPDSGEVTVIGAFESLGFPSGHVTTATVTLGTVAFVLARQVPEQPARIAIGAGCLAGIAISAWARIWYGAHWFTDTLGGALVGATILLIAGNLSTLVIRNRAIVPQQSPPQTPAP